MSACTAGGQLTHGRGYDASQIGFVLIDVGVPPKNVRPLVTGVKLRNLGGMEAPAPQDLTPPPSAKECLPAVGRGGEPPKMAGGLPRHDGFHVDSGVPGHDEITFAHVVGDRTAGAQVKS